MLPTNLTPGRSIDIFGEPHLYERCDPDKRLTIRSGDGLEFTVADPKTGFPVKPTTDDLLAMLADGTAVIRADRLDGPARNRARAMEVDAATAKRMDPRCEMRALFVRAYDEDPCNLSDRALATWRDEILKHHDRLAEALDGWRPTPQTLRRWISKRGKPGERRMRDFVDMRGKTKRRRRLHPVVLEIMQHHVLAEYTHKSMSSLARYTMFHTDIDRVNKGQYIGPDRPRYDQPDKPYAIPSYQTYRLEVRRVECSATWATKHGDKAVSSRWRGGGHARMPTKIGALTVQDDTPLPMVFLVDLEKGVPIGQPLFTVQMEYVTRCMVGWDLSYGHPCSATTLRTFMHAGTPKVVPAMMAERYPTLAGICCRPDTILVDNATPHHSHAVEDALADVGTTVLFAGSEMPKDKALGERAILTIVQIFVSALPSATYDIPRAREYGYDPEKHAMITIEEARALLAWAIATYHITRSRALMHQQPALVWNKEVAKYGVNVLADQDEFAKAIGNVEHDIKLDKSGVVINELRYSDYSLTLRLLDDLIGLEPPAKRRTQNPTVKVKIKVDTEDVGHVHVWNKRTRRYVTLPCSNQDYARGMPLWLHDRIRAFAVEDALAFNTPTEQFAARAMFLETAMDVTPAMRKREKRLVGRLMDTAQVRRLLGWEVEVDDEADDQFAPAPAIEDVPGAIAQDLAAPYRTDAEIRTPRAKEDYSGDDDVIDDDADDVVGAPKSATAPRRTSRRASPEVRDKRGSARRPKTKTTTKPDATARKPRTPGLAWGAKFG